MSLVNNSFFILMYTLICLVGCSQVNNGEYDKSSYDLVSRGVDMTYPYVLLYKNRADSDRSYKEVYFDSTYKNLISKSFLYKNVANGPYFSYSKGKLFIESNFKDGKIDGKRIIYENGRVKSESFFKKGIKIGTWIEYDVKGKIIRKTDYDNNGNITQDISY